MNIKEVPRDIFFQLMKTFEKLQQGKDMITQLVVCWTIIISKIIIK